MSSEETIFEQAMRIDSRQERAAFLDAACAAQPELRREIESLLEAHARTAGILESPPVSAVDSENVLDRAGTVIGHYKLLEQIGQGGMGVVFMAEQTQPVKRRVALKIIKPGLDTKQVIARFEAERQVLAMMDHPSIAKVFDAGTTLDGRPYFVMELVRGITITEYSDQHHLTPRTRLQLFVQVCQAVQHAHQKGIIHRDIKPSNVLVTIGDGDKPIPKIIDFGIAKATGDQRLTDRTLFTEFRQLIGTPLYMSPEQAEMSQLADVDTRSDVYSLGVLLYELLTGTTPFDKKRLAEAAYDEVRRIIREEEPPRPSTRLSTLGETLTTISAHRQTDPKKLSTIVRGELDWIVMCALEKDRSRRYETANGLARDVERYLADQPVEACPPSRTYRLRKFARRNKAVLTTVGVIAVVLVVATAVSVWQSIRARRASIDARSAQLKAASERDIAIAEKKRADDQMAVVLGTTDIVSSVRWGGTPRRRETELRPLAVWCMEQPETRTEIGKAVIPQLIDAYKEWDRPVDAAYWTQKLGELLKTDIAVKTQQLAALAPGDSRADGLLQGRGDCYRRLGRFSEAIPDYSERLKRHPDDSFMFLEVAALRLYLGDEQGYRASCQDMLKRFGGSEDVSVLHVVARTCLIGPVAEDQLATVKKLLANEKTGSNVSLFAEFNAQNNGMAEYRSGNFEGSVTWLTNALDNLAIVAREEGASEVIEGQVRVKLFMAMAQLRQGHTQRANQLLAQARNQLQTEVVTLSSFDAKVGTVDWLLSQIAAREAEALFAGTAAPPEPRIAELSQRAERMLAEGNLAESETALQQLLKLQRTALGNDHLDVTKTLRRLSTTLQLLNKMDEAEQLTRESLRIRRKAPGDTTAEIAESARDLGDLFRLRGDHADAEVLYRESLALEQQAGAPYLEQARTTISLCYVIRAQGRQAEADPLFQQSVDLRCKGFNIHKTDEIAFADHIHEWGHELRALQLYSEAERLYEQALSIRRVLGNESHAVGLSLVALGNLYRSTGDLDKARQRYEQALGIQQKEHNAPAVAQTLYELGGIAEKQNRIDDSERLYQQAIVARRKAPGGPADLSTITVSLARLLDSHGRHSDADALFKQLATTRPSTPVLKTALDRLNWARTLEEQGRFADAEPVLREFIALRSEQVDDHVALPIAKSMLAASLLAQAKEQEAESQLQEAFDDAHKTPIDLGSLPRFTEAMQWVSRLYEARGNSERAAYWRSKSPDTQTVLHATTRPADPLDADVLVSKASLGGTEMDLGDYVKAEPLLVEASQGLHKLYGEDNADTLECMNGLATLYVRTGRVTEAEALALHVLAKRRALFGNEDRDTLLTLSVLVELYTGQKKYDAAASLLAQQLEGFRKLHDDHNVLSSTESLANIYNRAGEHDKAEAVLLDSLKRFQDSAGKQSPWSALLLIQLANHYLSIQSPKAEATLKDALSQSRHEFGWVDERTIPVSIALIDWYLKQNRKDDADAQLRELLDAEREAAEGSKVDVPAILHSLGNFARTNQYLSAAVLFFRREVDARRRLPESTPVQIADASMGLALAMKSDGQIADAANVVREVLAIREQEYPAGDYQIAKTRSELGGLLITLEQYDEAEKLLLPAYADLCANPPPLKEAPRTSEALNRIIKLYEAWNKPDEAAKWRAKLPTTSPTTAKSAQP